MAPQAESGMTPPKVSGNESYVAGFKAGWDAALAPSEAPTPKAFGRSSDGSHPHGECNDCHEDTGGYSVTHCERCALRHDVAHLRAELARGAAPSEANPPAERVPLPADAQRLDDLCDYFDSSRWIHSTGKAALLEIEWFIGDGSGSITTVGRNFREACDAFAMQLRRSAGVNAAPSAAPPRTGD